MSIFFFFLIHVAINIFIYFNFDKISKIINMYDVPDHNRKLHKLPVSNIGGLIIFFNIILIAFLFLIKKNLLSDTLYFHSQFQFISFFIFTIPFIIIGVLDDKVHLSANVKMTLLTVVLIFVLYIDKDLRIYELRMTFLESGIQLNNFTIVFTLFSILLFINALNMMDGINLLVGMYSLSIFLFFIFYLNVNLIFIFMIIGLINYLILNYHNKVFLGDNGTILLAYTISYFFIKSYNYEGFIYADQIFLIMMIPGLDMLRVAVIRIFSGISPFKADRAHLHHLFSDAYNHKVALTYILLMSTVPTLINLLIIKETLLIIILVFFIYTISVISLNRKIKYH
tara:strand:+ start:913 stop:1932 length:1020 start_codon:yes stop_codon:yes gene_type:complete